MNITSNGALCLIAARNAAAVCKVTQDGLCMRDFAVGQVASKQWHAWRMSRRLLKAFWKARRMHPELSGVALNEKVIIDLGAIVSESPTIVVKHAQESFAAWPAKRPLRLRNIAHYVAYSSFVNSHPDAHGTRSDIRKMVE